MSRTYSLVTSVPRAALSVSSRGAAVRYLHRRDDAERVQRKINRRLLVDLQHDILFFAARNPVPSALMVYTAGRRPVRMYIPWSSLCAVTAMPVPSFVIVTVAFGTMAPLWSLTTPRTCAV